MSNGPIQFPAGNDLPIIGQPMTLVTWFPTVSVVCNCEARQPLLIVGFQNLTLCPKCGRGFQLNGVRQNAGETPHFDIGIVMAAAGSLS